MFNILRLILHGLEAAPALVIGGLGNYGG